MFDIRYLRRIGVVSDMTGCERFIGVAEVAEIIGLSETKVKQMAREGELPMKKIGKLWRTRPSDIDEWFKAQLKSAQKTGVNSQERHQ